MMIPEVRFGVMMPMLATVTTWPKTAEEAAKFCRERNAENRRRRETEAAEDARRRRELDDQRREIEQHAPRRAAQRATGATLRPTEIYRELNESYFRAHGYAVPGEVRQ